MDYTIEELEDIFKWNKVIKAPIATTESLQGYNRCFEIEYFMETNSVKKFVVIDDMRLDCFDNRFINTNMET